MRAITSLSAWHKEGRPAAPDPLIEGHSHDKERVRVMVDSGFGQAKANQDKIRNEVEVQRLQLLADRQLLDT